jgi:hypothetical protein
MFETYTENVNENTKKSIYTLDENNIKSLNLCDFDSDFVKKCLSFHQRNIFKSRPLHSFREKLGPKKIILVVDNSGSMNLPIGVPNHLNHFNIIKEEERSTRQQEAIFSILGALHVLLNVPGCNPDIYFLNPINGVAHFRNIFSSQESLLRAINALLAYPSRNTPTVTRFINLFENLKKDEISNAHILFFTDGEPYDSVEKINTPQNFYNLISQKFKNNPNLFMNIMICSDNEDDTEYINILDQNLNNVDATSSFFDEYKQTYDSGSNINFEALEMTHSGYMYKVIVGCLDEYVDKSDEKQIPTKSWYNIFW